MTKLERFAQLDGMLQTSQAIARGIVKPTFYEDLICQNLFQTHQLISLKDSPTNKSAVRLKNYQDIQKYINLNFSRQQQISGAS